MPVSNASSSSSAGATAHRRRAQSSGRLDVPDLGQTSPYLKSSSSCWSLAISDSLIGSFDHQSGVVLLAFGGAVASTSLISADPTTLRPITAVTHWVPLQHLCMQDMLAGAFVMHRGLEPSRLCGDAVCGDVAAPPPPPAAWQPWGGRTAGLMSSGGRRENYRQAHQSRSDFIKLRTPTLSATSSAPTSFKKTSSGQPAIPSMFSLCWLAMR